MKAMQKTEITERDAAVESGLRSLATEITGLESLATALKSDLGPLFSAAVNMILASTGRVIISGMGKSGHIGRKMAATLASTGTPAYFVHPGGNIGVQLKQVRAVMHSGDRLPFIHPQTPMSEAILTISSKGLGCAIVIDADGRLCGLVTDGDLRRHMSASLLSMTAEEIMTKKPKTIAPDALVAEALEMVDSRKLNSLIVVQEGKPVGLLHVLDLLRIGAA